MGLGAKRREWSLLDKLMIESGAVAKLENAYDDKLLMLRSVGSNPIINKRRFDSCQPCFESTICGCGGTGRHYDVI